MQELFERVSDLQETKKAEISLSYLEIYNETIRDLLVPGGSKAGLTLREDANQTVSVGGLSSHHPNNVSRCPHTGARVLTGSGQRSHGNDHQGKSMANNVSH